MGKRAQREVTRLDFATQRRDMVEHHIAARGVRSEIVLRAMRAVRREEFLPSNLREFAYEDSPLPIASGQAISQPYIVAFMIEALLLKGGEDVLEIGTGSGYAAAVLAEIAKNVYSVERIGQLAEKAATTLAKQGYHNVHVRHGDGTRGWPEHGLCVPKTSSAEIPVPAPKFPVPPMASALFAPR
jgi:protein-L-isoaspartate(D-aspartate) O-methyltransferase